MKTAWYYLVIAIGLGVLPLTVSYAVTTRQFSLDSAGVLSAGKLEGAAVLSTGVVVPSAGTRRIALENVGLARSVLVQADGSAFIGTGNDGKILKLTGDVAKVFAVTGELLVASLAVDAQGTLYAGTLPKGKIFAIDKQGKSRVFAQPEGAEHVWDLAYDAKKRVLFAATGPHGKVFAIDAAGKAEAYYASKANHIMALALDPRGRLYAGTSDDALLLRIDAKNRAEVIYDFEGNEVTALSERAGRIVVAANLFPKPATGPDKKKDENKKDDQQSTDKTEVNKDAPKPGTGELWLIEESGQARKLFASEDGHITAVQWGQGDIAYAATSKDGRIYRVQTDGTSALWFDVDERQVLDFDLSGAHPLFVTGDAGAAYRVLSGPASESLWTSKVLDAQFLSRWGALSWRGKGKLSFQTRSGSTDKADDGGWSEWSSALAEPGPIRSAAARFLQIRARFAPGSQSELYAVQAYYLPANQTSKPKDIAVKPATPKKGEGDDPPTTIYKIEWKVENPDADRLRYRLFYRPEGRDTVLPILRESEILTRVNHDWNTAGIPDGYYRLRIEVSDELDNPSNLVQRDSAESEPFLLDNHPPHVEGLRYAAGVLTGVARDALGPISKLEYALDGQEWQPLYPKDHLFDTRDEPFELKLEALTKGTHVVAIRARDARDNSASSEIWITIP